MSTDGCFRPLSSAAIQKVIDDPEVADAVMGFHPPYDRATGAFFWPDRVRELWDALLRSGGEDTAAAGALQAEMNRLTHFRFWTPPEDLQQLAAAGVRLDDIPAGVDFCGARWPDMHFLLTGAPMEDAFSPLLGPRQVGTDPYEGGRALTPDETAAAADALLAASDDEMRARYAAAAHGSDGNAPDADELVELFVQVRACYAAARAQGQGMLVYLE